MPSNYSIMGLHLRYRLWIAELNSDITVLRIFDEYMAELATIKNEPVVKAGLKIFSDQFTGLRKEIDDLRHEMHLDKMKLAALSKNSTSKESKVSIASGHSAIKKRYVAFRKNFEKAKKEFGVFESKWMK